MEAYSTVVGNVASNLSQSQVQKLNLGQSINNVISQTAAAANSEIIAAAAKTGKAHPPIK
jgi:hypothetical protein